MASTDIQSVQMIFTELRDRFREGSVVGSEREPAVVTEYRQALSLAWDRKFPNFPPAVGSLTSFRAVARRGDWDAYLKQFIQDTLSVAQVNTAERIIVNPVAVFGRHARDVATMLPDYQVIASDIFMGSNRLSSLLWRQRSPQNYSFVKDNIFAPRLMSNPRRWSSSVLAAH